MGSLLNSIERRFGAFASLAATVLTVTEASNQTFPFIRIPHYAAHAAKMLQLTNAVGTYMTLLVPSHLRQDWESYASSNHTTIWKNINETLDYQKNFQNYYGPMPNEYNWSFRDTIYTDFGDIPENSTQPFFLPEWHIFPLVMKWYGPANWGT